MKKELVYDFPTRVFHWCFSILFITAFVVAKTVDDESPVYRYHMLVGLTLGFLVTLRLIWGAVGSRHARFTDFVLSPKELFGYFLGIVRGDKKKWAGHNPASSWAALVMMALVSGSAITGFLMTSGEAKESLEEIHELFANTFVVVALLHIAGIIVHSLRYREMIGLSMIHGKKMDVPSGEEIRSQHIGVGILLIGLLLAFGISLIRNYDEKSGMLQFFGTTLTLGEIGD